MTALDAAPWIALATFAGFVAATAWLGWRAWRSFTSVRDVNAVAMQLLDVHQQRLDATITEAGRRAGGLADEGEELANLISELRADVTQLRWLLDRIPEERARLRRELLETVLPTAKAEDREHA